MKCYLCTVISELTAIQTIQQSSQKYRNMHPSQAYNCTVSRLSNDLVVPNLW